MYRLAASFSRAGWRVGLSKAALEDVDSPVPQGQAADIGMQALTRSVQSLGTAAGPWQLELPKAALGRGEWAIGHAQMLADACQRHVAGASSLAAPLALLSRRSAEVALEQQGLKVAGRSWRRFKDRVRYALAALIAIGMIVFDLLRHASARSTLPPDAGELFALHGEWSNRTRLLLDQVGGAAAPAAIIVLGRPRRSLDSIGDEWRHRLGHAVPTLVRPFSIRAAVGAIPRAARTLVAGWRLAPSALFLPGMPELVGMVYRALLGQVSAQWWNRQRAATDRVWYGHTGLADTTGLELAQQACGTQTVHVVHGISGGLNFIARSSLGVFRCGHDADWHAQLGGYGRCEASPAPMPSLVRGERGFLLISNLAHPMNPSVKIHGVRDEIRLLEAAATAATAHDAQAPLAWRPHPAVRSLPVEMTQHLYERAQALGFARLGDDDDLSAASRVAKFVLCSTSTVVVELLAEGVLPIMLSQRPAQADSALSTYPIQARDAAGLVALLAALEDVELRQARFREAWSAIRPAMPLGIRQVAEPKG